jgi:hypothetical protein
MEAAGVVQQKPVTMPSVLGPVYLEAVEVEVAAL